MDTTQQNEPHGEAPRPEAATYEPPTVECVLTADELAREIHYAGQS